VLECYGRLLASANFAVQAAKTGDEALEILAHRGFDVVLMEYLMPGSDGLAVLRAIKNLWPDTEVVVITGAPSVEHAKKAIRFGACDYLAKPVPPDEVSKAVARAAIQKKWALRRIPGRNSAQPTHEGESS
jgi:DNA-binding NtrC family response regulator